MTPAEHAALQEALAKGRREVALDPLELRAHVALEVATDALLDALKADRDRLLAENARLGGWVEQIAAQHRTVEMDDDTANDADWEGGFNIIVDEARALLTELEGAKT